MNKKIIKAAIKDGTLRKYDLTQALAGDKVLGWQPGEVLAVYGEVVVIRWNTTDGKSTNIFLTNEYHGIYIAPLCWVEGKPVYKGDVLYSPGGMVVKRVVSHVTSYETYDKEDNQVTAICVWGDDGIWDKPEKLTWSKPKRRTITINGHKVPAPERTPPKNGTECWMPDLCEKSLTCNWVWSSDVVDTRVLARGIVHLTREAAFAHAKALLSFNTN